MRTKRNNRTSPLSNIPATVWVLLENDSMGNMWIAQAR